MYTDTEKLLLLLRNRDLKKKTKYYRPIFYSKINYFIFLFIRWYSYRSTRRRLDCLKISFKVSRVVFLHPVLHYNTRRMSNTQPVTEKALMSDRRAIATATVGDTCYKKQEILG